MKLFFTVYSTRLDVLQRLDKFLRACMKNFNGRTFVNVHASVFRCDIGDDLPIDPELFE